MKCNRALYLSLLALLSFVPIYTAAQAKPNIVLIYTDDQGYGDLGCFGGDVQTPRIDELAKQGARLTCHYAAPSCTPSRAALMTGSYAYRVGLDKGSRHGVLLDADTKGLHLDEVTIAEVLKKQGYATACFGKWHLGDQPQFLPTRQGFDVFFGLPYSHDIHPLNNVKHTFSPLPMLDGEKVVDVDPDPARLTRTFTDKAIAFIRQNRDQPFFIYVPHPMPHRPIDALPAYLEKFGMEELGQVPHYPDKVKRDGLLKACLNEIDQEVGRIVDELATLGLTDNTIIVFTTDNGPAAGSAGPLRGRKGSLYEGGPRVPCVVRWPGVINPGTELGGITTVMDWLPTFAAAAGAAVPDDRTIDGKDLTAYLAGKADRPPHDTFLYFKAGKLGAIRKGPWKLIGNQLYNLDDDIREAFDLAAKHPDIVAELRQLKAEQLKAIKADSRPAGKAEDPVPLVRD